MSNAQKLSKVVAGGAALATVSGIVKGNGSGVLSAAVSGTDLKTINSTSIIGSGDIALAVLGANTFTGEQTFKETKDTVYNITDGANFEIDPVNGNVQTITLGAARTALATNFAAGQCIILGVDDGSTYALTWPSMTWVKSGGTGVAPTLATSGYTWVVLWKQGSTLFGAIVGSP